MAGTKWDFVLGARKWCYSFSGGRQNVILAGAIKSRFYGWRTKWDFVLGCQKIAGYIFWAGMMMGVLRPLGTVGEILLALRSIRISWASHSSYRLMLARVLLSAKHLPTLYRASYRRTLALGRTCRDHISAIRFVSRRNRDAVANARHPPRPPGLALAEGPERATVVRCATSMGAEPRILQILVQRHSLRS